MYRNDMTRKEIERAFAERSAADETLLRSLRSCDRRHFLRVSMKFAGMAAAASIVPAHAFQLVNVASAAAFMSAACMGAYNASKAAVVALSETLHQELAPAGVQVTVAMPGFFRTRLMEHARAPAYLRAAAGRLMDRSDMAADAVAGEILARAASGELHLVLPADYRWLWRFKRLAPRTFARWLARQGWRRPSQGG